VLNGLQKLTLLRDIELRVYDVEDEDNHQEFTCQSDMSCDDKGCYLCPRGLPPLPDAGTTLKWRLTDSPHPVRYSAGDAARRASPEPRSAAAGGYAGRTANRPRWRSTGIRKSSSS
jgi:hypothetical protein